MNKFIFTFLSLVFLISKFKTEEIDTQKLIDSRNLFDFLINFNDFNTSLTNIKASKYYNNKINVTQYNSTSKLKEGITAVSHIINILLLIFHKQII